MNEKELAQAIETAVNNYSFDPKKVAAQIPLMPPHSPAERL